MRWDAEMYDSTHGPQFNAGLELMGLVCVKADDAVLDIGCGTGRLTRELARLAHNGRVVGIDPSAEMLERAKEVASSAGNMALMQMSAQEIEFKEEFTVVYSNSALQWIREQEDVIARSYRALRQRGKIAIQLPAADFCWALTENIHSAISALGLESKFRKMEPPWRFPLANEMEVSIKDAGFVKVNVYYREDMFVFESINDVLGWSGSAALRPFLARLNERKQERFKYAFAMGFENYRGPRGIEFPYRRLFAFAEK